MLQVTDAAITLMACELDRRETSTKVVRFCRNTEGLHLRLSKLRPGDQRFGRGDRTVIVVDDNLAQRLTGRKLDLKHTAGGTKLALYKLSSEGDAPGAC
jgi:hypothetical protein